MAGIDCPLPLEAMPTNLPIPPPTAGRDMESYLEQDQNPYQLRGLRSRRGTEGPLALFRAPSAMSNACSRFLQAIVSVRTSLEPAPTLARLENPLRSSHQVDSYAYMTRHSLGSFRATSAYAVMQYLSQFITVGDG